MPGGSLIELVPTIHAGATCFMAGLIWFVQIVHYPLMAAVHKDSFASYERQHQRLTTLIVGPAMLVEAVCAGLITTGLVSVSASPATRWVAAAMLVVIWISTFFVQVPLHGRLQNGFDPLLMRRLIVTNWVRTLLWSTRAVLAMIMMRSSTTGVV